MCIIGLDREDNSEKDQVMVQWKYNDSSMMVQKMNVKL